MCESVTIDASDEKPLVAEVLIPSSEKVVPKEMKTFAPYCLPGSVVGTHDWNGQFGIESMIKEYKMEVILQDICAEGKTKMQFWTKGA